MTQVARHHPGQIELVQLQTHLLTSKQLTTPYTAVVGITTQGSPVMINLASPQVGHLLVADPRGDNREILRTILTSLAINNQSNQLRFVFIDSPRKVFGSLAALPHLLYPVLNRPEQVSRTLQTLVREMDRRNGGLNLPHIAVVISDLAHLNPNAWPSLVKLVESGPASNIHIVGCLGTNANPRVKSLLRYHFPVRLLKTSHASPQDGVFAVKAAGEVFQAHLAHITSRQQALVTSAMLKQVSTAQPGSAVARPAQPKQIEIVRTGNPTVKDAPYAIWLLWKFAQYQIRRLANYLSPSLKGATG
jgi:hypothetical protein